MLLGNSDSKRMAYGGILLALNMIILMITNIVPINTLFIMGLASLIISVVIMEFGLKNGVVFYIASVFLSFIILSNKFQWVLYSMSFAIYGIIKYIAEKNDNLFVEYSIKLLLSNILMIIIYLILKPFINIPINIITVLIFQAILLAYDKVYTGFIIFYNKSIRKNILK